MLQRTQLMIDEQTKQDLEFLARSRGKPVSKLVREYLKDRILKEKKKYAPRAGAGATATLTKMAEAAKKLEERYGQSRPTDVSSNIDHYLYGAPKKKV